MAAVVHLITHIISLNNNNIIIIILFLIFLNPRKNDVFNASRDSGSACATVITTASKYIWTWQESVEEHDQYKPQTDRQTDRHTDRLADET